MSSAASSAASSVGSTTSESSYTSLADLLAADGKPVTAAWDSLDFGEDEGSNDILVVTAKGEIIFIPPQHYLPAHEDFSDCYDKDSSLSKPSTTTTTPYTLEWVDRQSTMKRRQLSEFGQELADKPRLGPIKPDEELWPLWMEQERKKEEAEKKSWKRWFGW
ncbi:hypothetical protein ACM66B_000259 [Microbotryomycetes sp. NB124-2]